MYFLVRTCYLAQIDSTYLAQIYMVQINPTASFLIYVNFNFFDQMAICLLARRYVTYDEMLEALLEQCPPIK